MPIDYERLMRWPIPEARQSYGELQLMLYALGLNIGQRPSDENELRFVYEEGLVPLPTAATVLGYPGFWLKEPGTGIDWKNVLHGEQSLTMHRSLPRRATVVGRSWVDDIVDKGARGAFLYTARELRVADTGELLATLRQTTVCRSDGGFGGPRTKSPPSAAAPDRMPDVVHEHRSSPQQALLYRLNGDLNPLHADPAVAWAAGFTKPILHGLCTYGMAAFALIATLCNYSAERMRRLDVRFTGPLFPGETVRTLVWKAASGTALFRCLAAERGDVVLDHGVFEYEA